MNKRLGFEDMECEKCNHSKDCDYSKDSCHKFQMQDMMEI